MLIVLIFNLLEKQQPILVYNFLNKANKNN